jgi:3-oxoacyl-[acyl-carrier protein] reductase
MADWERKPGFDLTGKRAVVVGFGTPAGEAIALALAEAGADVATASATPDGEEVMAAKRASKQIVELGRVTFSQAWDASLGTNVQVSMRQLVKEFGAPDIAVFAGDTFVAKPIEHTSDAEFARAIQGNLAAAFHLARSFFRELPQGRAGRLIFVTPVFVERGLSHLAAYGAAKAGILGLVRVLSQEGAPRNITVNAISTGWMDWTPGRGPDDISQNRLLRYIPMRRFGKADELGPLAVWLASDAAGFVTGQVFHVDGGLTAHL